MHHLITHRLVLFRKRFVLRVSQYSGLNKRHFFKDEIMFSVFCKYLLKDAPYRKRPLFMKYASFNYASIGTITEKIGAKGEAVEQFEVTSLFERRNNILRFFQISPKVLILQKKDPLYEICII